MADTKTPPTTSQAPQGTGPLGLSGVSPSGTVERGYLSEFVAPHLSQSVPQRSVPCSPPEKGSAGRR